MTTRLLSPVTGDGASGDSFGFSLASAAPWIAVAAPNDTLVVPGVANGVETGSVILYRREQNGSFTRVSKLINGPLVGNGDNTGTALAFLANEIAVGIPRAEVEPVTEAGIVKLFAFNASGAVERQVLRAVTPQTDERFGFALAASGNVLAVGVPRDGTGRVEIFVRGLGGYERQQVLWPEVGAGEALFGHALAMDGDELLIGAPDASGGGAVYRARRIGGQFSVPARLGLDATPSSELGAAIAVHGNVAVVGAPGGDAGRALVLSLDNGDWTLATTITAQDGTPGMRYGAALAIDNSRLAVGAFAALGGDGAVYAYPRAGTALGTPTRIDIANGGTADRFGISVGFVDELLLAGTDQSTVGNNRGQGSVRAYAPNGASWQASGQIDTGDGGMYDRYGTSVAVHGDIAVVGAYLEDAPAGVDAGNVHWFRRSGSGWQYGGALPAPDGESEDRYGIAVALDAERLIVGAYWDIVGNNVDQGSAYVFRRNGTGFVFEQKLTAALGNESHLFGFSVDIDGDVAVIGARGAFANSGRAHLFQRQNGVWVEGATLAAPTVQFGSAFGASVALRENAVIVGAPVVTLNGVAGAGEAYQFTRTGTFVRALSAPILREGAAFGFSVDTDGASALVGAFQDGSPVIGAAYVFNLLSGNTEATLTPQGARPGDSVGISVAIEGDSILLGASGVDVDGVSNAGAAYRFLRNGNTWAQAPRLISSLPGNGSAVGRSVALHEGVLVLGAPGEAIDNPLEGTALIVDLERLFGDGFESLR